MYAPWITKEYQKEMAVMQKRYPIAKDFIFDCEVNINQIETLVNCIGKDNTECKKLGESILLTCETQMKDAVENAYYHMVRIKHLRRRKSLTTNYDTYTLAHIKPKTKELLRQFNYRI